MKNKYLPLLMSLLLVFALSSCSHTKLLIRPQTKAEINHLGNNKKGYIKFKSGTIVPVKALKLTDDSLAYESFNSANWQSVRLNEIERIYFKDHFVGLFEGSIFGFLGGIVSGYLYVDKDTDMAGLAIAGFSAGGLITGAIIGGIIGSKIEYQTVRQSKNPKP